MNEEDMETVYDTLMEVSVLLYVLKMALDNDAKLTNDTIPYACLAKLIQHKLADVMEIIQP